MRWIKLDGKKDPSATEPVLIWMKTGDVEWWAKGILSCIVFSGSKKGYVFSSAADSSIEYTDATHYAIIEKPKE